MKTILLPVDLFHDTGWEKALEHAQMLAKHTGAELHLLTVIPDYGMPMVGAFFPKGFSENAITTTTADLAKFVKDHVSNDIKATQHVRHGTVYKEIQTLADKLNADMIVMASHRPEMKDYMLGPNAARVVRHANQTVTVVR